MTGAVLTRGRWLGDAPVPYTGSPGATDPATGVPRILSGSALPW